MLTHVDISCVFGLTQQLSLVVERTLSCILGPVELCICLQTLGNGLQKYDVLPMEEQTLRQRNVLYCSVGVRKDVAHYCLVTGKTWLLSVLSSSAPGFLHWVGTDVLGRPASDVLTQVCLLKETLLLW